MMNKKTKKAFVILLAGIIFLCSCSWISADTTADKIQALEEKAANYRKLIEIKQQQQGTLASQLSLMEAEDKRLEVEIEIKKNELGDMTAEIDRMNAQIQEYEKSIQSRKVVLGNLIRSYYENKQGESIIEILAQNDFYFALKNEDSALQVQDRVKEVVNNIDSLKNNLESEKKIQEQKQDELADLTAQLQDKNAALDNKKAQKRDLLQTTKGEEARYQQLLANVEKQKEELLAIDELSTAGGLSADIYDKPTEGLASTGWFYSQKDPRWGDDEIGRSRSKMKDWGCAVTSVAMVFKYFGNGITPGFLANSSKYFSWDLIRWPTSMKNINLMSSISHNNIKWATIDGELKAGNPVIVYIRKTNGRGGHYVVIHHKTSKGQYVVHDPYFGANIFLDTSMALVGKMGADSPTVVDQMIIYHRQ